MRATTLSARGGDDVDPENPSCSIGPVLAVTTTNQRDQLSRPSSE